MPSAADARCSQGGWQQAQAAVGHGDSPDGAKAERVRHLVHHDLGKHVLAVLLAIAVVTRVKVHARLGERVWGFGWGGRRVVRARVAGGSGLARRGIQESQPPCGWQQHSAAAVQQHCSSSAAAGEAAHRDGDLGRGARVDGPGLAQDAVGTIDGMERVEDDNLGKGWEGEEGFI